MASATVATKTITVTGEVQMTGMQKMASKMWAPWIAMGLMIVVVSFIVGLVMSGQASDWWSFSKVDREAATAGTSIVGSKVFIESTKAWLPGFKFFGLGMMLGGITFLLATILGNLRLAGGNVQRALGAEVKLPVPPMTAKLFPMLMMMGMMMLMVAFGVSIWLGVVAADYWNHSIATELNPAQAGSALLGKIQAINATNAWLTPFKFLGMAFLFSSIALALVTIVTVLRFQSRRLLELLGPHA